MSLRFPKIPYPGSKGRLAPDLVKMMPRCGRIFLDVFTGRGNVFFAAAQVLRFKRWCLNDMFTFPFFEALLKTGGHIDVPERTKEEFEKMRLLHDNPKAILLEPYLTYNGGGYKRAGFGGNRSASAGSYSQTLVRCAKILVSKRARILGLNWLEAISGLGSDDFVFFDPPYYGADVRAYNSACFDHATMVKVLLKAKFRWMLTEYEQEFYLKAFGRPCFKREMQLCCDGLGFRHRQEHVWRNFDDAGCVR